MASYQIDFRDGVGMDAPATYNLILRYKDTAFCLNAQIGWDYFMGENTTISNVRRMYWKDGERDKVTGKVIGAGFAENKYVANNKIGYGFFTDMVTQKVDTLFKENPTIATSHELPQSFIRQFGYALRNAGEKASAQAVSYLFLDNKGDISVFSADRSIAFHDEHTGELKALIRWWNIPDLMNSADKMYWEVYTEEGVTTYCNRPKVREVIPLTPYRYKVKTSAFGTEVENIKGKLPIVEFYNNDYKTSDLSSNIRSKIDIIDLVQSGFANNIEDFSDVYWVIKDAIGDSESYYQDFVANINRTKKLVGEGAEVKQVQIPTEARSKFVEIIKDDLIRDGGVVDTKALTNGNLTATAIKASRSNLEVRVSKFEWQAYDVAMKLLELFFDLNGWDFDADVVFNQYKLDNETEVINNLVAVGDLLSAKTKRKKLQSIGWCEDADNEELLIEEEKLKDYGGGGGIID